MEGTSAVVLEGGFRTAAGSQFVATTVPCATSPWQYEYVLRDHLGNTRVLFADTNGDGSVDPATEILNEAHYYPFGMALTGEWDSRSKQDYGYLYNGKELTEDFGLNWYAYGARFYDPSIGRFTGVDPISDQFAWVSTYNYAENEPVGSIDLWGLQRAKHPFVKANFHFGITAGETGYETKLFGARSGLTIKTGKQDFVGVDFDVNEIDGVTRSGSLFFSNPEETWGVSGGDVLGGELAITLNPETGETQSVTSINAGLFFLKSEESKEKGGKAKSATYLGMEFGYSAGFLFGIESSLSIEIKVSSDTNGPQYIEKDPTVEKGDNTKVNKPLMILQLKEK